MLAVISGDQMAAAINLKYLRLSHDKLNPIIDEKGATKSPRLNERTIGFSKKWQGLSMAIRE